MAPVPPKSVKTTKIVLTTKIVKHNHQTRPDTHKGPEHSRWAYAGVESSQKASTAAEFVVEKAVSATTTESAPIEARKIVVSTAKRTLNKITPRGTEVPTRTMAANASIPPPPPAAIPGTADRHNHSAGGAPICTTI